MRRVPKNAWLMACAPVLVTAAKSCGTTSSASTTAPATSAPTAAASPSPSSPFTAQTAPATVKGKITTVLTASQGRTLYCFTPGAASKTLCTGSCAQTWPPLLFTGTGEPTASTTLPGE